MLPRVILVTSLSAPRPDTMLARGRPTHPPSSIDTDETYACDVRSRDHARRVVWRASSGDGARLLVSAPVTRVEFRVRYAETDRMGVVYHGNYLIWCEIGRTEHIRQFGMSYREMEERGVALAVAEASIRYQKAARYDDPIRVETTLADVSSRTVTFDYAILNADSNDRLATARTTLVSLDSGNRVVAIPQDVRAILRRASGE